MCVCVCVILIPQARVLCLIYTHAPSGVYQAKHECLWYKCYVPHYPCRLIACQYEAEIRIYYIDRLGKFDYGLALFFPRLDGQPFQHRWHVLDKQEPLLCLRLSTKTGESYGKRGSSYKRLNSCFVAIASFHKVYYTSKGLAFFLK